VKWSGVVARCIVLRNRPCISPSGRREMARHNIPMVRFDEFEDICIVCSSSTCMTTSVKVCRVFYLFGNVPGYLNRSCVSTLSGW